MAANMTIEKFSSYFYELAKERLSAHFISEKIGMEMLIEKYVRKIEYYENQLTQAKEKVENAENILYKTQKEGINAIKDPFIALKHVAEKYGAWNGWNKEVNSIQDVPPLYWVKKSKNLSYLIYPSYKRAYWMTLSGKKVTYENLIKRLKDDYHNYLYKYASIKHDIEYYQDALIKSKKYIDEFNLKNLINKELSKNDIIDYLSDYWDDYDDDIKEKLGEENVKIETTEQVELIIHRNISKITLELSDGNINFTYEETYDIY